MHRRHHRAETLHDPNPARRRRQRNSTAPDIIDAVRLLVRIAGDDLIAGLLNRNGLVTGNGNRWSRERLMSLRSHHRIPVRRPAADSIEPWLNLTRAAVLLQVTPETLRRVAENGEIETVHALADGPRIFSRTTPIGVQLERRTTLSRQLSVGGISSGSIPGTKVMPALCFQSCG